MHQTHECINYFEIKQRKMALLIVKLGKHECKKKTLTYKKKKK